MRPEERLSPAVIEDSASGAWPRARGIAALPLALYGIYLFCLGTLLYIAGVFLVVPRYLLGLEQVLRPVAEWLVWYSGVPMILGLSLALVDLVLLLDAKRPTREYREDLMRNAEVTVALTAYNDEESIGPAVRDFLAHPRVKRVIVVSNNSVDRTVNRAQAAGAIVINEDKPGYGACVYRCYAEALRFADAELIVLCEGDCTFRAADIEKLVAYSPHADIVNGSRIVETLRERSTQLTTFMFYGNLFVAKLLEAKHLGRGTLTDVGSTYKLIRRRALERLMPDLSPAVNLEFNAHFIDIALSRGLAFIECPVTFHARVGLSKGGNVNNFRALKVGLGMMRGITFGWRPMR
ncbi:MAG: glycosyltransferase family 2 protein [Parvularculaceae bacterium]